MYQDLIEQSKQFNANPKTIDNYQIFYINLHEAIKKANKAYYEDSNPIMDDSSYDILLEAINFLKENRKLYGVSVAQDEYLGDKEWEIAHKAPMLSQQKVKDEKGILAFIKSVKEFSNTCDFVIEPKFDGLSIELVYENGVLKDAVTRWNWHIGESVMRTIKHIPTIPQKLNWDFNWVLAIRGEVILPIDKFLTLEKKNSNPRNLASWILRTLEPDVEHCKLLTCYAYDIIFNDTNHKELKTQEEMHSYLQTLGFNVHAFFVKKNASELASFLINEEQAEWLQNQDIEMDGYVVKVNCLDTQKQMWFTGHHPKSSFAFKYQGEQTTTKIIWVTWQVGKSGILTPVAELEPTKLWGVIIKRATLHNMDFIIAKGLHINNYVYLQRSGDVIPYIVWVDESKAQKNLEEITFPTLCPTCKERVVDKVCCNSRCPSKMMGKIMQVVGKNGFDLDWFWNELVQLVTEKSQLSSPCQILELERYIELLEKEQGYGDKKIYNLKNSLSKLIKTPQPLENILVAYNIPLVNRGVAKILVWGMKTQPKTFDELQLWLFDEKNYKDLYWIGEVLAKEINRKANSVEMCMDKIVFETIWLQIAEQKQWSSNFHFSITGTFSEGRNEIVKKLEEKGAIFHASPSKQCNVVFVWAEAWGSKLEKAQKLWIPLVEGDEALWDYVNTH